MANVLLTAFAPYGEWEQNASWLAVVELTKDLPPQPEVTTRLYPVDFDAALSQLSSDLESDYDYVLHVGQAPGSARVQLEAIGVNVAGRVDQHPDDFEPLSPSGAAAYRSALPLKDWAHKIRDHGVPANVSYHAGTYLCNAVLYWTHYVAQQQGLKTTAAFIHLPLATSQVLASRSAEPSLPATTSAQALRVILDALHESGPVA